MDQKPITVESSGLVCDNPECSYEKRDIAMQDYGAWIGALCPDCGEPLLTQEQYDLMSDVLSIVNMVNDMADDPFMADLMSKIDTDMQDRQASFSIKCTKEAELEVGEIKWKDH